MIKRFFILLILIESVYAVNVTYIFNNDVIFDVYKCEDDLCNNLYLISQNTINNNITYNYLTNGVYAYAVYKECYYPIIRSSNVQDAMEGLSKNIELNKKQDCKAEIINNKIKSPFSKTDFTPNKITEIGRKEYFNAEVNFKLFKNNQMIEEKIINLDLDETKDITYGNADLIETEVIDCKCSNSIKDSKNINSKSDMRIEQVNNSKDEISTITFETCEYGDGCKTGCLYGDKDCSCKKQGYECNEGQSCKGNLLKNWEGKICCSINCGNGTTTNTNLLKYLDSRNKTKISITEQIKIYNIKDNDNNFRQVFYLLIALIILIFMIIKLKKHPDDYNV